MKRTEYDKALIHTTWSRKTDDNYHGWRSIEVKNSCLKNKIKKFRPFWREQAQPQPKVFLAYFLFTVFENCHSKSCDVET
jgi:hypothetical protein